MASASASVSYHALLPSPSLIHSHHLSISSVRRRRCCLPNPNATALSRFRPVRTASASPLAAFETEDKEARSDDEQEWAGGIGSAAHGEEEEELDRVEPAAGEGSEGAEDSSGWTQRQPRPCELFVCNLPRRYGVDELLELFGPYGTVLSVEVSRDAETGISRGCGFVTMRSFAEARTAINALDGFDLDGREMFVKLAAHIVSNRRNPTLTHTPPMKDHIFESPYKIYVGNLAWSVQPQHLREHFTHCGTVVSTRLLSDRKGGRNRVYGFLSFSSTEELQAALQLNNTKFQGRDIIVREAHVKSPDS